MAWCWHHTMEAGQHEDWDLRANPRAGVNDEVRVDELASSEVLVRGARGSHLQLQPMWEMVNSRGH